METLERRRGMSVYRCWLWMIDKSRKWGSRTFFTSGAAGGFGSSFGPELQRCNFSNPAHCPNTVTNSSIVGA